MATQRHFLGWDEPLTASVRRFLVPEHPDGPVDLDDTLIVVPTHQAGRQLREALAVHCSTHGSSLLGIKTVSPPFFLHPPDFAARAASPAAVKAAWTAVLLKADPSLFPALFPARVTEVTPAWAMTTGELFQDLRETLADGGYRIADVAALGPAALEEPDRWTALAELEKRHLSAIAASHVVDPCIAKIEAPNRIQLDPAVQRIVVAAVPDPSLLVLRTLEKLARKLKIVVLVHAPKSMADRFDEWGRPIPERWAGSEIAIPEPDRTLVVCANPAAQSRAVMRILREEASRFDMGRTAIGVPDREIVPFLKADLDKAGIPAFDPSEKPLLLHPAGQVADSLASLLLEPGYDAFRTFVRHPDVLEWLTAEDAGSPAELLAELDEFQNLCLPAMLADFPAGFASARHSGKDFPHVQLVHKRVSSLQDLFRKSASAAHGLRACLREIYGEKKVPQSPEGREFETAAGTLNDLFTELDLPVSYGVAAQPPDDALRVFMRRLAESTYQAEREDSVLDLEGWLELPWNSAPLLLVTGVNEESVPGGRVSDVFLPDSLRRHLRLRHDADRLARDAMILSGLIATRKNAGQVYLLLGKTSARGDPLKPSRLLFRCADAALARRARHLFRAVSEPWEDLSYNVSFRLNPALPADLAGSLSPVTRMSVTSFRSYLACPFRFYLQQVLGMEAMDDLKTSLDALDFGSIVHAALDHANKDASLRDSADAGVLAEHLVSFLRRSLEQRFGEEPPLPVTIFFENARHRLEAAAQVQVRLAQEGWETIKTEIRLEGNIGGMEVSGQIDRIDRHRKTGTLRIIDYKTSDSAEAPPAAHLGPVADNTPAYALPPVPTSRPKRWVNLQLPLYLKLAREHGIVDARHPVELCYFNLPKAITDTNLYPWEGYTAELQASAERCAEGIIADVRAGRFWPPAAAVDFDDFGNLILGDPATVFDPGPLATGSTVKPAARKRKSR